MLVRQLVLFNFVLTITLTTEMTIKNQSDHDQALSEIRDWLKKRNYDSSSLKEIQTVINAVESYMGIPLPAKEFILGRIN